MRIFWLLFAVGLLTVGSVHAGLILQYETIGVGSTPGGNPIYRFTYTASGDAFLSNQELEIRFNPALYGPLSNASAPAGFDLALFQPNNPPGTIGVYSALALVNNPSLATPFRVDAVYLGQGAPGTQEFYINQYSNTGEFRVIGSGTTSAVIPVGQVPEPATLTSVGVILGLIGCAVRRRSRHPA